MPEKFNLQNALYLPGKSMFFSAMTPECIEIKQYFKEEEKTFIMWFFPGKKAMGPPGYCHGGLTSAILDETMGSCCWLNGYLVVTARMEVRYKAKIPVQNAYIATSNIKSVQGRRIIVNAEITDCKGKIYAFSEGTFLSVSPEKLESPQEYGEQIEKAVQFFKLRQCDLSIKEIFKQLGMDVGHPS
jgi:acyl-coenzyme A thioesterase PaaI-like protein